MKKSCMYAYVMTALALLLPCMAMAQDSAGSIAWQDWSPAAFETARREHKLVLLEVGAGWCHWCHVMDDTTYRDGDVIAQLRQHYVTVRVDQDSHPDLSRRYENYGWPATIIFAPDGTEIVKRRGYIDPPTMKLALKEAFEDPRPHLHQTGNYASSEHSFLAGDERDSILTSIVFLYDQKNGGWGYNDKFLEADLMQFSLAKARTGNPVFRHMSEQSLALSYNLIDPVWGGVYQYSDSLDWKSPHFEKILSVQADYLLIYSYAYGVFGDKQYRDAADKVVRYLNTFMTGPGGAFYTSQDADISDTVTGHVYYALDDVGRRKLGPPHTDTNIYTDQNGRLISSLLVLYAMTGDSTALAQSQRAMHWLLQRRALPQGGFSHGGHDKDGPFLSDISSSTA